MGIWSTWNIGNLNAKKFKPDISESQSERGEIERKGKNKCGRHNLHAIWLTGVYLTFRFVAAVIMTDMLLTKLTEVSITAPNAYIKRDGEHDKPKRYSSLELHETSSSTL